MSDVVMSEQCNCIDLMNEALRPHNTYLGLAIQINRETGGISTTIGIETALIEKKRGAKPMRILASFCPFCGTAYAYACAALAASAPPPTADAGAEDGA